jgi:hypothetical protein
MLVPFFTAVARPAGAGAHVPTAEFERARFSAHEGVDIAALDIVNVTT